MSSSVRCHGDLHIAVSWFLSWSSSSTASCSYIFALFLCGAFVALFSAIWWFLQHPSQDFARGRFWDDVGEEEGRNLFVICDCACNEAFDCIIGRGFCSRLQHYEGFHRFTVAFVRHSYDCSICNIWMRQQQFFKLCRTRP